MIEIPVFVPCKFEMYIIKIALVISKNVRNAFLYVLSIYIYIYMVGLNHQQCKTIFTERFRLSPSSEFTGTRKKIKISTFLQVNQEKTK